jgi:hypothetical protein
MTENFSFKRLWLLIKKQAAENLRLYLLFSTALLLVLSLVLIFSRFTSSGLYSEETIYIIYTFGLLIAGAIFASFSFQQLSSRDKAIYFLAFPASTSEKLTAALFFNLVVLPLTYTFIYFIVKSLFWVYLESVANTNPELLRISYINWNEPRRGFMEAFPYFFYAFFAIQGFYIMGSVYFTRFGFIKTTIVGIILIFLFVWYINEVVQDNFEGFQPSLSIRKFQSDGQMRVFELGDTAKDIVLYVVRFIWAPVFWLVTYFRLKETEV